MSHISDSVDLWVSANGVHSLVCKRADGRTARHHAVNDLVARADKAAANKEMKYSALANTHIFFPVAIETSGVLNQLAVGSE